MTYFKLFLIIVFYASSTSFADEAASIIGISKSGKFILLDIGQKRKITLDSKLQIGSTLQEDIGIARIVELSEKYSIWKLSNVINHNELYQGNLLFLKIKETKKYPVQKKYQPHRRSYYSKLETDKEDSPSWAIGYSIENLKDLSSQARTLNQNVSLKKIFNIFNKYRIDFKIVYGKSMSNKESSSTDFSWGSDIFLNFKIFSLRPYLSLQIGKGLHTAGSISSNYIKQANGIGFLYKLTNSFDLDFSYAALTIEETFKYIDKNITTTDNSNAIALKLSYNF